MNYEQQIKKLIVDQLLFYSFLGKPTMNTYNTNKTMQNTTKWNFKQMRNREKIK